MASNWLGTLWRSTGAVVLLAVLLVVASAGGCGDVTDNTAGGVDSAAPTDSPTPPPGDAPSLDVVSSCHPGGVQTFTPSAYHPASAAGQGACLAPGGGDLFALFYSVCLGPNKTQIDCDSFKQNDGGHAAIPGNSAACAACLLTPSTAAQYGPLIDFGGFILPNVAGCLELVALQPIVDAGVDPQALSCAKSLQALEGCELAACEANCPVQNAGTLALYNACASDADRQGCQEYAQKGACADSYRAVGAGVAGDGGVNATPANCFLSSFKDFYDSVAPLFCGPPAQPQQTVDAAVSIDAAGASEAGGAGDGGVATDTGSPRDAVGPTDAPTDALADAPISSDAFAGD